MTARLKPFGRIFLGAICLGCLASCTQVTPADDEDSESSSLNRGSDTGDDSRGSDVPGWTTSSANPDEDSDSQRDTATVPPVDCSEIPEVCNGRDDNCDGRVDEGCECLDGSVRVCGSGIGACELGEETCDRGKWGGCVGDVGPSAEACNGADDDCDGIVDNGCECVDNSTMVCGSALGVCEWGVQACKNGRWGICEGDSMPREEVCNGLDDDCDGITDNGCDCVNGVVNACGSAMGECEPGNQVCVEGRWSECVGGVGPVSEVCNGLDDDCDSRVDEGFGVGEPCDGDDIDECEDDVVTCDGCSSGDDDYEICNNLDDDCDGITDEGCDEGGGTCIGNHCICVGDTCQCPGGGCSMVCDDDIQKCLCDDGGCDMTCTNGAYCRCDEASCAVVCTSGARCESFAESHGSCVGEGTYCCGMVGSSEGGAEMDITCPER